MSIVLNEYALAEQILLDGVDGSPNFETLCRVAKYFCANGMKRREIMQELEKFLLRCDPYASTVLWRQSLEKAANAGMRYKIIQIERIIITEPELKIIRSLKGIQLQRLAFTLLCVAHYMIIVRPETDGWVNVRESEIMKMANINTSKKRCNLMYGQLIDLGLLKPSKKISNLNVRVNFIEEGDTALEITDMRNLGNQYMMYLGKPFFSCKNCGLTVKVPEGASKGKMKYCPECATKIHIQQTVNSVMRSRMRASA